jgi:hypothetical protein
MSMNTVTISAMPQMIGVEIINPSLRGQFVANEAGIMQAIIGAIR